MRRISTSGEVRVVCCIGLLGDIRYRDPERSGSWLTYDRSAHAKFVEKMLLEMETRSADTTPK